MDFDIFLGYGHFSAWLAVLLDRDMRIDMVHDGQRLYASIWRRDEGVLLSCVEKDAPHPLKPKVALD